MILWLCGELVYFLEIHVEMLEMKQLDVSHLLENSTGTRRKRRGSERGGWEVLNLEVGPRAPHHPLSLNA